MGKASPEFDLGVELAHRDEVGAAAHVAPDGRVCGRGCDLQTKSQWPRRSRQQDLEWLQIVREMELLGRRCGEILKVAQFFFFVLQLFSADSDFETGIYPVDPYTNQEIYVISIATPITTNFLCIPYSSCTY